MLYDQHFDGVVLSNDLNLRAFHLQNFPHRLGLTKDRLQIYYAVFLFPKKAIHARIFNEKMAMLQETGHIEFWIKNFTDHRIFISKQRQPSKLRMANIAAIFQICAAMYLISFVIFIMEIISKKCRCVKQFLDYLTY